MNSATQILDIAERRMRQVGYNAVSFRGIASEMGLKSASVHYHFPTKEDLGVALVRRYSENFRLRVNKTEEEYSSPEDRIETFVEVYRRASSEQNLICLCSVLGAEIAGLPQTIRDEVDAFFRYNIKWLTEQYVALGDSSPEIRAKETLALLTGSMIIQAVTDDCSVFGATDKRISNN